MSSPDASGRFAADTPANAEIAGASHLSVRALTLSSTLFATGAVAGKVIGFIMLPILARSLSPDGLGRLDVLFALGNSLTTGLLLGLDVAALRLFFDQPDARSTRRLLASWYGVSLVISVTAAAVLVGGSEWISRTLFASSAFQPAVAAVGVAVVAGTVQVVILMTLRATGKAGWYVLVSVGTLLLYAVLAVLLLYAWRADVDAVVGAWAVALLISAVCGTLLLRGKIVGRPSWPAMKSLLRLGLPLAPAVVMTLLAEFLVRILLLGAAGPEGVAYFAVGNRFASVAALSLVALQLAWVPRAYALGTSLHARERISTEATWIVALVSAAAITIAVGSRTIVPVLVGDQYLASLPALGWGLVGVIALALFVVASIPNAVAKRTGRLAVATASAAALSVVGTALLAPAWGAAGATAAVALGEVAAVVIVIALSRGLPIRLAWGRLITIGIITSGATLILVSDVPLAVDVLAAVVASLTIASALPVRRGLRGLVEGVTCLGRGGRAA
jgi:O-antigen/teichoic acid export membrane protein